MVKSVVFMVAIFILGFGLGGLAFTCLSERAYRNSGPLCERQLEIYIYGIKQRDSGVMVRAKRDMLGVCPCQTLKCRKDGVPPCESCTSPVGFHHALICKYGKVVSPNDIINGRKL